MNEVGWKVIGLASFLLLALTAFSVTPAQSQPDSFGFPSADKYGITDLKGKELLPAIYADIKYLGHGLFLLKQMCPEPAKSNDCCKAKLLLNSRLKKLNPATPSGTTFQRILWLGSRAEKEPDFVASEIPKDALFVFQKGSYYGVCDSQSKVIVPAECVWIGNFSENIVSFRNSDGLLYTYNFASKILQKLAYQNVRHDFRLTFREGLAIFATAQNEGKSLWGFMDPSGKIVIKPQYAFAQNFNCGRALVRCESENADAHNELIDKSGKLVSPPGLNVIAGAGSYIQVQDSSGNFGVVNHKFEYVIQPKYTSMCAEIIRPPTVDEFVVWEDAFTEPTSYLATRKEDGKQVHLSLKGNLISVDAPGHISRRPTHGAVAIINHSSQFPSGFLLKEIPVSKISQKHLGYQYQTKFGPKDRNWQQRMSYPDFSRLAPKDRTLQEYVCEPLKTSADAVIAQNFTEALRLIENAKLDESKVPIYQPVYIRALCHQSLGRFEEAKSEYATIIKDSYDLVLKEKAKTGLDSCALQQKSIPRIMLTFPARWSDHSPSLSPLYK